MAEAVDHGEIVDSNKLRLLTEARERARDDFLLFCKLMMSHPDDPYDPERTLFSVAPHHNIIAQMLEKVETGEWPRVIVTLPPRHGKTEMCAKMFIPWCIGRDPYRSSAYATYNDEVAGDVGRDILAYIESPEYEGIFPEVAFRKGAKSATRFTTINEQRPSARGGTGVVVGRGTALTGRGFHVGVCDDLLKDGAEADSAAIRDRCWDWFTKVFMTRQMEAGARILIMITRWHEDDIVGRITDPENPYYSADEAKKWKVLNVPAIAETNDPLKRKPGEALWPDRYPIEFLEGQRRLNARAFQALYQQKPTPEEGVTYQKNWFVFYRQRERPKLESLRLYAASDHAVATDTHNDKTCMVIYGVDSAGIVWLIDCWWGRANPHVQVETMIGFMEKYDLMTWWGEDDTIQQTIGPWLRKRKAERGVSCVVHTERYPGDKEKRSAAMAGLMADRRVRFPKELHWGIEGMQEMLKFPRGNFDDFCDVMAIIGRKVNEQIASTYREKVPGPERGTFGWLKQEMKHQERQKQLSLAGEDGW